MGDLARFDSHDPDRNLARIGPVSCTILPVQDSVRDLAGLKLREGSRQSGIEWLRPLLFEREPGVTVAEHRRAVGATSAVMSWLCLPNMPFGAYMNLPGRTIASREYPIPPT